MVPNSNIKVNLIDLKK